MSSRLLRKLQEEKEKELIDNESVSDVDIDAPIGGTRKKQLNINRYDLLNQQSHSESEFKEDDNETEAPKSCHDGGDNIHESVKRKRKRKKKKSGNRSTTNQRSSEDNADVDEVERSVREVNRVLGEDILPARIEMSTNHHQKHHDKQKKSVLSIQKKCLNPANEMKKMFGSKVIQTEQYKRKNRTGGRGHNMKFSYMVNVKDNWPQMGKSGLSMSLLETKDGIHYFTYEHSQSYRLVENRFLNAVESLNPDNIVAIINEHPYQVNALIQLSDLCKISEDYAMAADLIERALFHLEYSFHTLFNIAHGNCRLSYKRQENRPLYITIFKHLTFLGGRACCRTSLEFCKLLLTLDGGADPLAIKLAIDFYALRAKEYQWLIDFVDEFNSRYNLMQLPSIAFSCALANFYIGNIERANYLLQDALMMFPNLLFPLLSKCSIQIDSRVMNHEFFISANEKTVPECLSQLTTLYVNRNYHIWKDGDLLPWLERNVHAVLDRVDRKDPWIEDYANKRQRRFAGNLPVSVWRHLFLSSEEMRGFAYLDSTGTILSFDPLPPKDSINSYTRKKKPPTVNTSSNPLTMFFGSLMPNFNPNQLPGNNPSCSSTAGSSTATTTATAAHNQEPSNTELEDTAHALPQQPDETQTNGEFRRSVASLVDAMRELLNNLRPVLPQSNDADDDNGDVSADDDLT